MRSKYVPTSCLTSRRCVWLHRACYAWYLLEPLYVMVYLDCMIFFFWLQDQKVHRYKRSSRQGTSWNQPLARTSLAPLASKTGEHHMFLQPTTAVQGTANGKEGLKHASITTVQDTIKVQRTEVRMRTIKEHTREVNNAKTRIHADSRQVRRQNYIPCNACTMQPDTTSRL